MSRVTGNECEERMEGGGRDQRVDGGNIPQADSVDPDRWLP